MSIEIRWAGPGDAAALVLMLEEMEEHYRQPPLAEGAALAAAERWLAKEGPDSRHFALAFDAGRTVGLASVAIAHPGGELKRLLFLKDLFVAPELRGRGIGKALMGFLARYCRDEGIGRIDLTTENWNDRALGLYLALGATRQDQKIFLRFDSDALARLAGPDEA